MGGVHLPEVGEVARLSGEQLDHLHAGDGLLEMRVQSGDLHPHLAERLAHLVAEDDGADRQKRHHGHRDRGQPSVDAEDHVGEERHDEQVRHQGDHAHRKHLGEVLEIVGEARHQSTDRIAIEEAHRQPLHLIEEPTTHVLDRLLAEDHHRQPPHPLQNEQQHRHRYQDDE